MIVKKIVVKDIFDSSLFDNMKDEYEDESKVSTIGISSNPQLNVYQALEKNGSLACIGAYDNDVLVGFMTVITSVVLHYSQLSTTIESQFILRKYRGGGTWKKMMNLAEEIAKDRGSFMLVMTSAIGTDFEIVANRSGFNATNIMYTKNLL